MSHTGHHSHGHWIYPWWMGFLIDNPVRKIVQPAKQTLAPFVREGMTALDLGCGFGHFTIGLAKLVGQSGRVLALDVQEPMLRMVRTRARLAGLGRRVETRRCPPDGLGLAEELDFALTANVLHELPSIEGALGEVFGLLRPGSTLLVFEPRHVLDSGEFERELAVLQSLGFVLIDSSSSGRWWQAVLRKPEAA